MSELMIMHEIITEIDVTPTGQTRTFKLLSPGIDSVTESLNEVIQDNFFFDKKGFGESEVTGMHPVYSFSGKRLIGDPAQDFIFSLKYGLGSERHTTFKLTKGDKIISIPVTISGIQEWSGGTTDQSSISFELKANGKPILTTGATKQNTK